MYPKVILPKLPGWQSDTDNMLDGEIEITHMESYLPDDSSQTDKALIEVYAGAMPEGSSAEQEAMNSYMDIIGEEEEEEEDPLTEWPFQKVKAYGYEAICDDDSLMRVMCIETSPGMLAIVNIIAQEESLFNAAIKHVEKNLTIA